MWIVDVFDICVSDKGMLKDADSTVQPLEANNAELLKAHTQSYLQSLKVSNSPGLISIYSTFKTSDIIM